MNREKLQTLLESVRRGRTSVEQALEKLQTLPYEDLGFAKIDHHRQLRKGFAEVILGDGKTVDQLAEILKQMKPRGGSVLVTRVDKQKAAKVRRAVPGLQYDGEARALILRQEKIPR